MEIIDNVLQSSVNFTLKVRQKSIEEKILDLTRQIKLLQKDSKNKQGVYKDCKKRDRQRKLHQGGVKSCKGCLNK